MQRLTKSTKIVSTAVLALCLVSGASFAGSIYQYGGQYGYHNSAVQTSYVQDKPVQDMTTASGSKTQAGPAYQTSGQYVGSPATGNVLDMTTASGGGILEGPAYQTNGQYVSGFPQQQNYSIALDITVANLLQKHQKPDLVGLLAWLNCEQNCLMLKRLQASQTLWIATAKPLPGTTLDEYEQNVLDQFRKLDPITKSAMMLLVNKAAGGN